MRSRDRMKRKASKRWVLPIILMICVGLFVVLAVWFHKNIEEKQEYRRLGIEQYQTGNWKEAEETFRTSLKKQALLSGAMDTDTRWYLADTYFQMGDYEAAKEQYEHLLKSEAQESQNAEYLQLQIQMAQAFSDYKNQNYEVALPAFQAAIEAGHMECALYAGICAVKMGKEAEEISYLTTYLSYNPGNAYACTELADYYLNKGIYSSCYQYLQQGLESQDRSCDRQLLFVEIVYEEYQQNYNQAYELIKEYMQNYPVTEQVQREYDFLFTRQTLE